MNRGVPLNIGNGNISFAHHQVGDNFVKMIVGGDVQRGFKFSASHVHQIELFPHVNHFQQKYNRMHIPIFDGRV